VEIILEDAFEIPRVARSFPQRERQMLAG